MALCQAVTSAGRPCPCRARDGYPTCGRHKNFVVVVDLTLCGQEMSDGSRCSKKCVNGDVFCKLHRTIAHRREQKRREDEIWRSILDRLWWWTAPIQNFGQIAAELNSVLEENWITRPTYERLLHRLRIEWDWFERQRIKPTAKAKTELQRIALDKQNVHTEAVNKQTADAQKYLLEMAVPNDQITVIEIWSAWSDKNLKQRKKVIKDIGKWYETSDCVLMGDWLYKKILDGLWACIKQHKYKTELIERLWEEASESVGHCCQGHLSRLTNVLVGFTDEVKAEVPVGEILQQKIAAISSQDIRIEEKVCAAWSVFEELKIPMDQRDAWIEAL